MPAPRTMSPPVSRQCWRSPRGWSLEVWVARDSGALLRVEFRGTAGDGRATVTFRQRTEILQLGGTIALPKPPSDRRPWRLSAR